MIILVDMDDVIADFNKGFLDKWKEKYPDKPYVPLEEITTFHFEESYPEELRPLIKDIYRAPGFIKSLEPMEGGLEALKELEKLVDNVFICTSPLKSYTNCVLEKYEWVDMYLGKEWVNKIVLTRDKTLVNGDILIDDNPKIKGALTPKWEHVLYSQPYNKNETSKRRLTWKNWKEVLEL